MSTGDARTRIAGYLAQVKARPGEFGNRDGGVRIALDADEIAEIETKVASRYESKGWPAQWAEVGVHYRDPFLRVLRDAVEFPGGRVAVHHRVLFNSGNPSGVAILPLLGDKIVLIRHFRHPSRNWHWEMPRGAIEPGQGLTEAAAMELSEEIGAGPAEYVALGLLQSSSSLIGSSVALFLGRLASIGQPTLDEGIAAVESFSVAAVESMLASGEILDSYTNAAFLRARLRGLI